jgi:uncharacterized protein YbjT (DUF2867 family)
MFVIAGATGQTGSAAARTLVAAGQTVRGLTRDPARAAAKKTHGLSFTAADVTDADALAHAFAGADGAYMLAPPNPTHPDPIGFFAEAALAIRTAARRAKLPRLVFLSSEGAHLAGPTGPIRGLRIAEEILADAAPAVTFLRPSYFQETWRDLEGLARAEGILPSMLAPLDARRSLIATADVGRVAAELLLEAQPPRIVELGSAEHYSARDVADALGTAFGQPVQAIAAPRDQWVASLTGVGLSEGYAELLAEMHDGINAGRIGFSGEGRQARGRVALKDNVRSWIAP